MGRACSTNAAQRNAYRILVGKPEGNIQLGNKEVGSWTILKWILEREEGMVWIGLIWPRIGISGVLL
jgi:hypothetical protein